MWLMLCMMFTAALLALNIEVKLELMGCVFDYASPYVSLTKLANVLIGGLFYLCLLKRGEKQALITSLAFVVLGLAIQLICGFVTDDAMLSTAVLMLGLGSLSMACFNTVLALGAVRTALRRFNFSLVLIPLGYCAGAYLAETDYVVPVVSQSVLLVLGLCFMLKARGLKFERQEFEPSPHKKNIWCTILCLLLLCFCFFIAIDPFFMLLSSSKSLCALGVIPAFWLGFIFCKKGWERKTFWLAPLMLLFTPLDAFLLPLGINLPHEVAGLGAVYFLAALAFPLLVNASLKGYEASPARLWVLSGILIAILSGLGAMLTWSVA